MATTWLEEQESSLQPENEMDVWYLEDYTNTGYNRGSHNSSSRPPRMDVPSLLWKLLDAGTQLKIREARELHNHQGTGGDTAIPNSKETNGSTNYISRQYSNPDRSSNKMGKEENEEDAPSEDPEEITQYEMWTQLMNTVKDMTVNEMSDHFEERLGDVVGERSARMTVVERDQEKTEHVDVRAHTGFYDVIASLVKEGSNLKCSTLDNGADTCVVAGTGWQVLIKATMKANLVGFNSNYARKKCLPIVTADTVVRLDDAGTEAIVRAHKTVYNEGSPTTLLSEFQVRMASSSIRYTRTIRRALMAERAPKLST